MANIRNNGEVTTKIPILNSCPVTPCYSHPPHPSEMTTIKLGAHYSHTSLYTITLYGSPSIFQYSFFLYYF